MQNLKAAFGRAAHSVLTSRPGAFVVRRSSWLVGAGYTGGNAIMTAKDGLAYNADTAAGFCLLVSSLSLFASQKYPTPVFRFAGAACFLGSSLLAYSALNLGLDADINVGKMTGAVINMGIGVLASFQKEIADYSLTLAKRPMTMFNKAVQGFSRYPVSVSAALDLTATAGVFIGAFLQPDLGMKIAMTGWSIGVLGLAASDPRFQNYHQNLMVKPVLAAA